MCFCIFYNWSFFSKIFGMQKEEKHLLGKLLTNPTVCKLVTSFPVVQTKTDSNFIISTTSMNGRELISKYLFGGDLCTPGAFFFFF